MSDPADDELRMEMAPPMRDPIETALDEARRLLGILHRKKFLESGRERHLQSKSDIKRENLRFKLGTPDMPRLLSFRRPFEDTADKVAAAFSRDERDYLLRLLDEAAAKKPPRRGRRATNGSRDFWIAQAVARLVETHGLTPTRNREPYPNGLPPTSACAIIARVLAELGVELSERGVEIIWERRLSGDFWWDERLQPAVPQNSPEF